jgi:hypothetical protein
MIVIIESINWLIKVTDNNDARWKPEIKPEFVVVISEWIAFFLQKSVKYNLHRSRRTLPKLPQITANSDHTNKTMEAHIVVLFSV